MTPMQKVASGLVIVVGNAAFPKHPVPLWRHYDVLADPVGWVLIGTGLFSLARIQPQFDTAKWLGILAGLVSVPMWFPQIHHLLSDSGSWAASLPQLGCCVLVARSVALLGAGVTPRDGYAAKRFGLLTWGFVLLAVLPVIALGGGVPGLENPTLVLSLLVNLAFIWACFAVHRREYLGGPGSRAESRPGSGLFRR
ncbi:MAG: hypothetical protein M3130_03370 [Actinomycetota bacterium]|nr:hypothetical protein [Actinomycetota bacterium]